MAIAQNSTSVRRPVTRVPRRVVEEDVTALALRRHAIAMLREIVKAYPAESVEIIHELVPEYDRYNLQR